MRCIVLCLCYAVFAILSSALVTQAQTEDELILFGASSLTNSFTALAEQFEQDYDVRLRLNFAGSASLAAQLIQGAPADIFASANQEQMQVVIDEHLIANATVRVFAENDLVLITPVDNPGNIETVEDLANDNVILVLASPSVPIREYSNQLLENLTTIYGEDFDEAVLANLVSEETNVRQIVARIVLGEADAGIVYRSDVTPDIVADVRVIELPDGSSPRASYPIAPLIESDHTDNALLFIAFVLSDAGQSILNEWGFCSPEISSETEISPEIESKPDIDEHWEIEASC